MAENEIVKVDSRPTTLEIDPLFKYILGTSQNQLKADCRYFLEYLKKDASKIIDDEKYLFYQGTHPVMLVAHLDTVHKGTPIGVCVSENGYIMSPNGIGGDDRCGVYMVMKTLMEIDCSVLFTCDEEIGCVGANKFVSDAVAVEPLNYIVEFDRKGDNDCVFYSCDNEDFKKFVEGFGFETAYGSCSDISRVAPYLKTAAVNLSSGYFNPHTTSEYIDYNVVLDVIARAKKMILAESDAFEYIEKVYTYTYTNSNYWSKYNNYEDRLASYYEKYSSKNSNVSTMTTNDNAFKDGKPIRMLGKKKTKRLARKGKKQCAGCFQIFDEKDIKYKDNTLCLDCYLKQFGKDKNKEDVDLVKCEYCGGLVDKKQIEDVENMGRVCRHCLSEMIDACLIEECVECGKYVYIDDFTNPHMNDFGETLCQDCAERDYQLLAEGKRYCPMCRTIVSEENFDDSAGMCNFCEQELMEDDAQEDELFGKGGER